jgi:hypothetical protein
MSNRIPFTVGSWFSFIDAWALYHGVTMSENARAVLCNAFGDLTEEEIKALQACPTTPRITVTQPAWGSIPETTVTYRPQSAGEPLQSTAKPAAPPRLMRAPPRTPAPAQPGSSRHNPSVPANPGTKPPVRIVRRTVPVK